MTETESEHHSLPTPRCPHALSHVSSEESNGTGRGWARSPPSTPAFPPPGSIGSVTTTIADQRQQLSAPTLGDVTPRCPRAAAFGHVSVRPSIPGCPITDFCLLLQPRNLQDSMEVGTEPRLGLPCPRGCQAAPKQGERGRRETPLEKAPGPRNQVPAPFPPLRTNTANTSPACDSAATQDALQ